MAKFKKLTEFTNWLIHSGAEIREATNEYELVRFRCGKGVGVIYTNKNKNNYTVNQPWVNEVISKWKGGKTWDAELGKSIRSNTSSQKKALLNVMVIVAFTANRNSQRKS